MGAFFLSGRHKFDDELDKCYYVVAYTFFNLLMIHVDMHYNKNCLKWPLKTDKQIS